MKVSQTLLAPLPQRRGVTERKTAIMDFSMAATEQRAMLELDSLRVHATEKNEAVLNQKNGK